MTGMLVWGWMKFGCGECRARGWYTWFRYCVQRSWRAMDECGAWMRGVGGVCEICMCLAFGGAGGEWMRGIGMDFINPVGT